MRKASQILYLIGGILAILGALTFIGFGVGSLVIGSIGASYSPADIYNYIAQEYPELAQSLSVELITEFLATAIVYGVMLIIFGVFSIVSAVFAFKATKDSSKKLAILNIVFGALGCTIVPIVGGILGLVASSKEE